MLKDKQNVEIVLSPLPIINLSPLGFYRYAKEFHSAAESYKPIDGFTPVPYYLYCRSLELLFKAYLLSKGITKQKLKKYSHNLNKVLNKSKELEIEELITISKEEVNNIESANKYYHKKGFEYFEVVDAIKGYENLPELNILKSLSEKLLEVLYEPCSKVL